MKEIILTQGKVALVDDENFEEINQHKWSAHRERNCFYAVRHKPMTCDVIRMHTHVIDTPEGMIADHIDCNGLNNQKSNLRVCTTQQNSRNQRPRKGCSSKFKGVSYHSQNDRWRATINVDQRQISLGCYLSEELAANAYNQKAQELFGDFVRVNQI